MTDTNSQMDSGGDVDDLGDARLDALMAATGDRMLAAIERCLDLDAGMTEILLPPEVVIAKSGRWNSQRPLIVLPGLLLVILLATLDTFIVSTSLPRIVSSLGGVPHLSWVMTAYILMSTIATPFYGKLGDMYGRKKFFIAAILIFLVGSALSGLSQSMAELITFRAIQGLGAGGLVVSAMATLWDLVEPGKRWRYAAYMSLATTLAIIAGPVLGGFITTSFSWRWIFYINIPLGGAALAYLIATLRPSFTRISHKIDYLGGTLIGAAATALVMLATWGGTQYAWGSIQIVGLGLFTAVAVGAFCIVETKAAEPILPLHIFKNRNFSVAIMLTFLVGLATLSATTFLPLYQQTVQSESPIVSGLLLIPITLGMSVAITTAGRVITRTGRYKIIVGLGGAITGLSMGLIATMSVGTTRLLLAIFCAILGLGIGFLTHTGSLIAMNSVRQKDKAAASHARLFFQQIGGSIGLAVAGAVFARRLARFPTGGASSSRFHPTAVNSLPASAQHDVFYMIAHATQGVFIWAALAGILIFALAFLIREVPPLGWVSDPADPSPAAPMPSAWSIGSRTSRRTGSSSTADSDPE